MTITIYQVLAALDEAARDDWGSPSSRILSDLADVIESDQHIADAIKSALNPMKGQQ